jgi:hypothetical protein
MRIVLTAKTWEKLNKEKKAGEDFDATISRILNFWEASKK